MDIIFRRIPAFDRNCIRPGSGKIGNRILLEFIICDFMPLCCLDEVFRNAVLQVAGNNIFYYANNSCSIACLRKSDKRIPVCRFGQYFSFESW